MPHNPVEIDPLELMAGDAVVCAWDQEPSHGSCHCSFRVLVRTGSPPAPNGKEVSLLPHDLKPGDTVIERFLRNTESDACHCDVILLVARQP